MKKVEIQKKSAKMNDYNFRSLFNSDGLDNPLDALPYKTTPPVEIANMEVSEVLKALKEERKNRLERYRDQLSSDFYIVVCFQSGSQKDEFIKQAGWKSEQGSLYYDGLAIARQLEISLTPISLERKIGGKVTKKVKKMEVID